MPHLSVATWNINSVRIRTDHIARFVSEHQPDVLCLQEIKCRNEEFPSKAFSAMGLRHVNIIGQKGSHGVAIASRYPLQAIQAPALCPRSEARVGAVSVKGITIHNLYVPAGGDEPDPAVNDKFAHKLEVLARMRAHYAAPKDRPALLVGDLNIAPGEHDVWSHKQLLNVVSHTPMETEALEAVRAAGDFVDLARALKPDPEKLYSWWSYRGDWKTSNRGRRLDHIWASPDLAARCERIEFTAATRGWDRPSDHIPVMARFSI
jgi:exodeoxyribonuclease III